MRIFILEDETHYANGTPRHPRHEIISALAGHDIVLAKDSWEARAVFEKAGPFDLLLLDHDMRGFYDAPEYPDTGYQFVKWLVNSKTATRVIKPKIILHSQNDEGRRAMFDLLYRAGFNVSELPFGRAYVKFLKDNYSIAKVEVKP